MHHTCTSAAVFACALFFARSHAAEMSPPANKPNIVFFLVDDMGWQETSVPFHRELTALNRRYRTPHMERLAAEGMKFTQAYASAVCSATRVSALTGEASLRANLALLENNARVGAEIAVALTGQG